MRSKLVVLSLVALTAGAAGTVGSRILTAETPESAAAAEPSGNEKVTAAARTSDPCRKVARRVRNKQLSDRSLRRLLRSHRKCRAVIVDSPRSGSRSGTTRIVTIPAPSSAPVTAMQSEETTPVFDEQEDHEADEREDHEGQEDGDHEEDHSGPGHEGENETEDD